MADYYELLGVSRTASADEIKQAYRKLAHQHHPDKDGGDEEKFKQINEAYQVLGDESKRQQYDRFGNTFAGNGAGQGPFGGFNVNFEDMAGFNDLGDIFGQMFGGTRPRSRSHTARRGADLATDIEVSFLESAVPLEKTLTHRLYQTCTHCHGNGAEPGTPIKECPTCRGTGTVTRTQQTPLGMFSSNAVCPTCQGEGKQPEKPCRQGRSAAGRRPVR
jgi:molecular chaperone DnaJ